MLEERMIYEGQKPTPEQAARIRALKGRPIVFDEEFPELTEEELREFKRVNPIGQSQRLKNSAGIRILMAEE